jgi:hypothetical protein
LDSSEGVIYASVGITASTFAGNEFGRGFYASVDITTLAFVGNEFFH